MTQPPDRVEPAEPTDAPTPPASGWSEDISRPQAIARSFKDPRTRWTAIAGCCAFVIFPIIMLLGLIVILLYPSPP